MHHLVQDELQAKHRRSRSQPEYFNVHSRLSRRKKKSDDSKTYYYSDSPRSPSPVQYTETKASILRRRKHNKRDDDMNEVHNYVNCPLITWVIISIISQDDDLGEVLRKSTIKPAGHLSHYRHHSSLNDLSSTQQNSSSNENRVPYSKNNSMVKRQNSEPLVGMSI